ncbi:MAG TPA: glutamine--tRNA ligase, partial [bacterium (Candidatus Stahlbacteria)]|nr:glutamine--tRNA ligase [Candidatus Stahlbacteria bacterium]
VEDGYVKGWDDPRMPTLSGLRRRGYTPEAIRNFCERIGIAKRETVVDIALLEHCLREDLNKRCERRMAVLRPVRLIINNYPDDKVEELDAINNPEDPSAGKRKIPFSKVLYIEKDDFREDPPPRWFRLSPGQEVRLKHAYIIRCERAVKNDQGEVVEIHCSYDPETKSGGARANRRVKGTLHWVSATHAIEAEVRLYDRLFAKPDPLDVPEGHDFTENINPNSIVVLTDCKLEPSLKESKPFDRYQFLRLGYFCCDPDTTKGHPVFNRTITLKDTWAKIEKRIRS